MKLNKRKGIFYSIYIFLLVFCPPIVPRFDVILMAFSAFEIYRKYRNEVLQIVAKSGMLYWTKIMVLLAGYVLLIPLPISAFFYNDVVQPGHYVSLVNRYGLLLAELLICGSYLILELEKNKLTVDDFLKYIFFAGAIESTFSVGALLSPSFKQILLTIMYINTGDGMYRNSYLVDTRLYGFSNTLLDLFGLGISVIASVCFVYGVFKNKRYILLSIYIVIATAINSRTGLVLYCVCVLVTIMYLVLGGNIKGILFGIVAILIGINLFNYIMSSDFIDETTKYWVTSGIDSVFEVLESGGTDSGSLSVLLQDSWWELPGGARVIIGTGHSRYLAQGYSHTDVGYVNEIWAFGMIGAAFLYLSIVRLIFMSIDGYKNYMATGIGIIILVEYIVFNIKAVSLGYNPGATAIFLILFVMKYYMPKKGSCRGD